jgi:type I restriction enzyme S subunit
MPEDRTTTPLSQYCEANTESLGRETPSDFRFRYLDLSSVNQGKIDWQKTRALTYANSPSRARRVVRPGDVLFSTVRPGLMGHGMVREPSDLPVIGSTGFAVLSPKDDADGRFLFHSLFLHDFKRQVAQFEVGSNYPAINESDLLRVKLGAVDGPSQSLIADILDALDDAILETDAVMEKLRTIHGGIIDDLLTRGLADDGSPREPSTLAETKVGHRPATWTVANLGRFVVGAEYGTNLSLGDSSAGIPVLRMNNIQDGEFDLSDLKYALASAVERFRLQRNDVLFNRTNSWEHVGKAAIWRRDEPGPAFASYLVRLHCGDALLPEFLHLWLNWAPVQRAIRQFATPGVQQVNINPTNLRRALIAVPDTLDEQRAIIERVNGVAAALEDHRRERAKMSSLREGLREDLLTGRKSVVAIREAAE